jgi:hypothetical protein
MTQDATNNFEDQENRSVYVIREAYTHFRNVAMLRSAILRALRRRRASRRGWERDLLNLEGRG